MTFLKKLGQILLQVGTTALGISPLITPLFGNKGTAATGTISTVANDLTSIASVIVQIETALAGKTGADKLAAAINLVGPIIKTSQLVSGKKIADANLMAQGIAAVTQGMVDVLNSLHPDAVSAVLTTGTTTPAQPTGTVNP